jgi:MFS family permease
LPIKSRERNCSAFGFKALMVTQFLGALNDNVFRFVVSLIIIEKLFVEGKNGGTAFLTISEAIFLIPFIIFSPYAGVLADRFPKSTIIVYTKVLEIIAMSLGFYFLVNVNLPALVIVLLIMGTQSTLFSPVKYGILPEILEVRYLSKGNGYIEFWTFLAIIFGIVIGGMLKALGGDEYIPSAVFVLSLSIIGFVSSLFVTKTFQASSSVTWKLNLLKEVIPTLRDIRHDKDLFFALIALTYFWLIGVFFKLNTMLYAANIARLSEMHIAVLFTVLAIGIGLGCITAGVVSKDKINLSLVPYGSFGISIFSILLSITYSSFVLTLITLFFLGFSSGFFVIPLNAFFQHHSPDETRGRYLAAMNFILFIGMVFACFLVWVFIEPLGMLENHLFLLLGASTLIVTYVLKKSPLFKSV